MTAVEPIIDPLAAIDADAQAVLAGVADHLIPAAHGMPSAGEIVTDARVRFVLAARPDLADALRAALRPGLGPDPQARLDALGRDEPANLSALQLTIVAGYYTDRRVRELIGYEGQEAIDIKSWIYPTYLEEGLIDAVMARGPVWRDPATGERAVSAEAPKTYAERTWATEPRPLEGGPDGRHEGT